MSIPIDTAVCRSPVRIAMLKLAGHTNEHTDQEYNWFDRLEQRNSGTSGSDISPKKNKIIFFVLNLFLMVPYIIKHYSLWGAAGTGVILLLAFLWTVLGTDGCAVRNVPLLLFCDVCVVLILSYQMLYECFATNHIPAIFESLAKKPLCILLMLTGAVLGFVPFKNALVIWGKGLGKTLLGAGLFVLIWGGGISWRGPLFQNKSVHASFCLYLLCALLWWAFCAASYYAVPDSFRRNNWLSWLLLAVFFTLCLTETSLVQTFITTRWEWLLTVPNAVLPWWKAVLTVSVLAGCAIAAYDYDRDCMGADSLLLGTLAGGVLLLRVLLSRYFAFSWGIALAFLAGSLRCAYNEGKHMRTIRLTSTKYMIGQTAVLLLATEFFKRGLWILVCILCVYGLIFYATAGKPAAKKRQIVYWLIALSCPATLAVGYIWRMRFLLESCVMVAVSYVVLALVLVVLHWPHPDKRGSSNIYKWIVCGFMTLLCVLSVFRYGTKVRITFDANKALVVLEARGDENRVQSAVYQWSSAVGEHIGRDGRLSAGETRIPIEGEKVTIVVTDAFGATTTVTDWYPHWLLR